MNAYRFPAGFSGICLASLLMTCCSLRNANAADATEDSLLPAEFVDVTDDTRFLVTQDENGDIHFRAPGGFYGGFVKYGRFSHRGRIYSIGAQYVIRGTVNGFLGYEFESAPAFPLAFQGQKNGLRYLCGKGTVKAADGKKYEFDAGDIDKWLTTLKSKEPIQRRAAATAVGYLGEVEHEAALIVALKDDDLVVRGLAAESLGRIGAAQALSSLKAHHEELRATIKKLDESIDVGNGSFIGELDVTAKPFKTWLDARMAVSGTGEVQDERVAKHKWVEQAYDAAIAAITTRVQDTPPDSKEDSR